MHANRRMERWQGGRGAQWLPARPQSTDGTGADDSSDSQDPGEKREAGNISVGTEVEGTRNERAGAGHWRWCHGILSIAGENVSRDAPAILLDAQDHECAELPAEVGAAGSKTGAARDLAGRDAEKAFNLFLKTCKVKYPKAAICLPKDREWLMAC